MYNTEVAVLLLKNTGQCVGSGPWAVDKGWPREEVVGSLKNNFGLLNNIALGQYSPNISLGDYLSNSVEKML